MGNVSTARVCLAAVLVLAAAVASTACSPADAPPSDQSVRKVEESLTQLLAPTGAKPSFVVKRDQVTRSKHGCVEGFDVVVEATVSLSEGPLDMDSAPPAVSGAAAADWPTLRSWPYQGRRIDGAMWGLVMSGSDDEFTLTTYHVRSDSCPVD